jgi:hypothetical protein
MVVGHDKDFSFYHETNGNIQRDLRKRLPLPLSKQKQRKK